MSIIDASKTKSVGEMWMCGMKGAPSEEDPDETIKTAPVTPEAASAVVGAAQPEPVTARERPGARVFAGEQEIDITPRGWPLHDRERFFTGCALVSSVLAPTVISRIPCAGTSLHFGLKTITLRFMRERDMGDAEVEHERRLIVEAIERRLGAWHADVQTAMGEGCGFDKPGGLRHG